MPDSYPSPLNTSGAIPSLFLIESRRNADGSIGGKVDVGVMGVLTRADFSRRGEKGVKGEEEEGALSQRDQAEKWLFSVRAGVRYAEPVGQLMRIAERCKALCGTILCNGMSGKY